MEKELREKYRKWAKIHVTSIHRDGIEKLIFQFFNKINLLESYHKLQKYNDLREENERLKEVGKEATSLIAHLKDQHGFNDEEQASQDKIMKVFKYEGRW